jgi:uracil-DNA glycosylase
VPLLTFVLVTVGSSMLEHHAPLTYYQTVAFLVPSLLVTLALQGQFFRVGNVAPPPSPVRKRQPHLTTVWLLSERAAVVALLLYLALGEFAALFVLATESPGILWFAITAGSVTTAFVAIGIIALAGTPWASRGS